jgi:hypothetical protein
VHIAGPEFSTIGMLAIFERQLPGGNHIRLSYANGDALEAASSPQPLSLTQVLATAHPRHAQMYSLSLSGTLDGTGTKWRASYRWQPDDTITPIASFAADGAEPWLNLHLRQPIYLRHIGADHMELMLDVRNLLAEGYQPFLLSDGSLLIFAQDQRSIRGGLAFNF